MKSRELFAHMILYSIMTILFAFQGITTPMGVATCDNVRIREIKKYLPTNEQIQQQIDLAEEYMKNLKMAKEESI